MILLKWAESNSKCKMYFLTKNRFKDNKKYKEDKKGLKMKRNKRIQKLNCKIKIKKKKKKTITKYKKIKFHYKL
jgi:hypothetical protein